jgi:hypothetical protein
MYHYKNSNTDETVAQLPKVWNYQGKAIMGLNDGNMAGFGWIKVETPDPVPVEPVLPESLEAKEQAFADKLVQLATKFQIDLLALPDINIGTMLTAAQTAGASETDIANASAILLALGKDVEAESGLNWADTWAGLKSRLPGYLQGA